MKIALLFLITLSLSGCATMNKEECLNANWFEIGREDGSEGKSLKHLSRHAEACSEHGVSPKRSDYKKGRMEGLKVFCTADNGLDRGLHNRSYKKGTCPKKLEKKFLAKYKMGKKIYTLKEDIDSLEKTITENETNAGDTTKPASIRNDYKSLVVSQRKDRDKKLMELGRLKGKAGIED